MLRNRPQSMGLGGGKPAALSSSVYGGELAYPTNITEPTLQCVVDIGSPILLANSTVNAEPISMVNPLQWRKKLFVRHRNFKKRRHV